jgi:opacity protein-like surface antigen
MFADRCRHNTRAKILMKKSVTLSTVVGVIVASLAAASVYADENRGCYLTLDAGANFLQNTSSRNGPGFGPDGVDIESRAGSRFDLMTGYRFNQSWAVEVEGGFLDNKVTKVGGVTPSTQIYLYQYPVLANVVFRHTLWQNLQVSAGAGAGGVWTTLDIDPLGDDTDFQYAYQAKAGITYAVGENYEFGITYKFLGTGDHSWTVAGAPGGSDGLMSHSILATITLKF